MGRVGAGQNAERQQQQQQQQGSAAGPGGDGEWEGGGINQKSTGHKGLLITWLFITQQPRPRLPLGGVELGVAGTGGTRRNSSSRQG